MYYFQQPKLVSSHDRLLILNQLKKQTTSRKTNLRVQSQAKPQPQTPESPFGSSTWLSGTFWTANFGFIYKGNVSHNATTGFYWVPLTYSKSAKISCRHTVSVGTMLDLQPYSCCTSHQSNWSIDCLEFICCESSKMFFIEKKKHDNHFRQLIKSQSFNT